MLVPILLPLFVGCGTPARQESASQGMSFFVTSAGPGRGADLGGLRGADQHCQNLAKAAGAGNRTWRAYLSASERGETVSGRGDPVNMHDILTGSQPDGRAFEGDKDMTCWNWTRSGYGSAMVGHHDRIGLRDDAPSRSWNSSHPSRGCSQEALRSTGGNGLFYCFAD